MLYYVILNIDELKTVMSIFQVRYLDYGITLEDDYSTSESIQKTMVDKNMLVKNEDHYELTPFINSIFQTVFHASAVTYLELKSGSKIIYYFLNEYIVQFFIDETSGEFIFYVIPFVPQMIGSLSNALHEHFPAISDIENAQTFHYQGDSNDMDSSSLLLDVITVQNIEMDDNREVLLVDSYLEGQRFYSATVSCTTKGNWIYTCKEDPDSLQYTIATTDYYKMIEKIGRHMIRLHGQSIRLKGDFDETSKE